MSRAEPPFWDRFWKRRRGAWDGPDPDDPAAAEIAAAAPQPFGPGLCWIAVPADRPEQLAEALGLEALTRARWAEGLAAVRTTDPGAVFVTPAVGGWVIAIHRFAIVPGEADAGAAFGAWLAGLSARFGEAQAFGTDRTADIHLWALAEGGRLRRLFAHVPELVAGPYLLTGYQIAAEIAAGLPPHLGHDAAAAHRRIIEAEEALWETPDPGRHAALWTPTEETVLSLAATLSVDPSLIGMHIGPQVAPGPGLLGRLPLPG